MEYEWYEHCTADDNSLQQGDFVEECPIAIPPSHIEENGEVDIDIQKIDSIVLSQSCDLEHGKIGNVLLCPYYSLAYWLDSLPENQQSKKARRKAVKNLKSGHYAGYHLLDTIEEEKSLGNYIVVDFKNVYGINYTLLQDIVIETERRVRLLPPYREHLSQAFARYFMRVGLPQDLRVEI